jgi:hypothetical protein
MSKIKALLGNNEASLFVFILWPFLGFLIALSNYNQKTSKIVVLAFFALYGFTIVRETGGGDLNANYMRFCNYLTEPDSFFFTLINGLFKEDGTMDLIQKFIVFFVSRFTSNVQILFLVYSIIFGYFYLKGVDLLHSFHSQKKSFNSWLMLLIFILIIPITNIGNFRFFSAVWIFFIGAYQVVVYKDNRCIIFALCSVLMHFGLIAANIILIIYVFFGNNNKLYLLLIVLSFLIPEFAGDLILQLSNKLGGGFEDKASDYLNIDYIENSSSQNLKWFLTLRPKLLLYYVYFMYVISYYFWSNQKNETTNNIFSFSLLFYAFTNFVIDVPSLGSRYLGIFNLFAYAYLFFANYFHFTNNKISVYSYLAFLPLILHLNVSARMAFDTINIWLLAPNPFPFVGDPISVWSVLFS